MNGIAKTFWLSLILSLGFGSLRAREREFCVGDADTCADDMMAVRFGNAAARISEITARVGDDIDAIIAADVSSTPIQGWSVAVRHDPEKLEILEATTEGLSLPTEFFNTTTLAVGDPRPGFISAIVLAIFPPPGELLPAGDNTALVKIKYRVKAPLDPDVPTFLEFINDTLVPNEGSPPTNNNWTIDSSTRAPKRVVDGEIRAPKGVPGDDVPFLRGDCNGDGKINLTDAILCANNILANKLVFFDCDDMLDANGDQMLDTGDPVAIIDWFYLDGPDLPEPFSACGIDDDPTLSCLESNCDCDNFAFYFGLDPSIDNVPINGDSFVIGMRNVTPALGFSCAVQVEGSDYSFAHRIFGPDDRRKVELFIVDDRGLELRPNRTNQATGPANPEGFTVTRGATLETIQDDFLSVDTSPVGGTGFVVAYATDLMNTGTMIEPTGQNQGCQVHEILKVQLGGVEPGECPPGFAFLFGTDAGADLDITEGSFPINMRNPKDALAFSFGVSVDNGAYAFADKVLGARAGREVDNIITDVDGITQKPLAANGASDAGARAIVDIAPGADIAGIQDGFFTFDLSPTVGGPGFTVGFAADVQGTGAVIPLTPDPADGEACPLNEIVIVSLEGVVPRDFVRGDCDGSGSLNVSDGAICAQNIFLDKVVFFRCEDMLDASDDGALDIEDPIVILEWVFNAGADLAAPFPSCGSDPTDDDLGCQQSNCAP